MLEKWNVNYSSYVSQMTCCFFRLFVVKISDVTRNKVGIGSKAHEAL